MASSSPFLTALLKSTKTLAIGPEVKAPTETDRTGLTVPVELTTVSTRPREIVAVTYFGAECCCHHDLALNEMPPTTPTRMARISSGFRIRLMMAPQNLVPRVTLGTRVTRVQECLAGVGSVETYLDLRRIVSTAVMQVANHTPPTA